MTIQEIISALNAKPSGNGWKSTCPAHSHDRAILTIMDHPDGPVFTCSAGDTYATITSAVSQAIVAWKSRVAEEAAAATEETHEGAG